MVHYLARRCARPQQAQCPLTQARQARQFTTLTMRGRATSPVVARPRFVCPAQLIDPALSTCAGLAGAHGRYICKPDSGGRAQ